jgi:hypothetical protein
MLSLALQPREFNLPAGRSKRLTAGRPAKASFRERKLTPCHVPETNGFGTTARISQPPRGDAFKGKLPRIRFTGTPLQLAEIRLPK